MTPYLAITNCYGTTIFKYLEKNVIFWNVCHHLGYHDNGMKKDQSETSNKVT